MGWQKRYGLQKLRTGHVHKEHLHGQRGVLVKLHVHAAYGAQHARTGGREHAQQRAQHQRQQQTGNDHLQRHAKALPEGSHVLKCRRPTVGVK